MKLAHLATVLVAVVFLLSASPLYAATPASVVINEIMWDETEYIELHNTTGETISLHGWSLTRQAAGADAKTITTFTEADSIPSNGFFLIEKQEAATEVTANKLVSGLTLLNTGELLQLLNGDNVVVDQANQLGSWYAGENSEVGIAMERGSDSAHGTLAESWHTSTGSSGGRAGTPGVANSEPPVNHAPTATVTGPSSGLLKTNLTYSAEDSSDSDDDELTFTWNFGDDTTTTGASATHTYTTAGTYTVRVTVSDGEAEAEATQNVTITAPVYTDKVVINEFLPNPVGSDTTNEFIELKNTDSATVDLAGWQLDDADGGSTPYTIPGGTTIAGNSIKSFSRPDTNIALNNGGDTVRLLDPAGVVRSTFTYAKTVPEGQSYNRTSAATYELSTTLTSGSENVITAPEEEEDEDDEEDVTSEKTTSATAPKKSGRVAGTSVTAIPLADVREEEVGTLIQTEGVVSAPPGVLGEKIFYLAGSGIQVYFSRGAFPPLKLGDKINLTGTLSSNRGEARLKVSSATDIKKVAAASLPLPHQVETGDIEEDLEGSLVIIQGEVTETSGDTFYVDDGSGEVKVFIAESTKIDKPKMKKGTAVTITGIVSETSSGYRLLPRFQEDVRLGLVAGLTTFPATGISPPVLFSLTIFATFLLHRAHKSHEPLLTSLSSYFWYTPGYGSSYAQRARRRTFF